MIDVFKKMREAKIIIFSSLFFYRRIKRFTLLFLSDKKSFILLLFLINLNHEKIN